jgi:phosphoribosylaminoimidazolecarboxamide formyltransferase/IMP cyclohydrolase
LGWEIISTSGTMKMIKEAGIPVTSVSDVTGFPEICDGRVKTLHPKIHGALLARRDIPDHMRQLKELGIEKIDLVCVNLYPFRETIAKPDVTMEDAVEHIDIGGPSMLRSAAKNWASVTVVVNPEDYKTVIDEIKAHGDTTPETRLKLSAKAYTHTAEYDIAIATYMRAQAGLDERLFLEFKEKQALRYGENPHQSAKFYSSLDPAGKQGGLKGEELPFSLASATQLSGKELSYNNIQDANAALNIVREFDEPFAVGLKHMNPCGAAVGKDIIDAWKKTFEGDKVSIYGGIVAFNREVTLELAQELWHIFLEIVMAPSFTPDAVEFFKEHKKNTRVLVVNMDKSKMPKSMKQFTYVNGGCLYQDQDLYTKTVTPEMAVTKAKPEASQMDDLNFAWKMVKHVKSNAIVVVKNQMLYGVGAGQMNRVGSAELALKEAAATLKAEAKEAAGRDLTAEEEEAAVKNAGLVMGSDAFFPFDDCVTMAAEYGVKAIAQPGGSIRDEDSVKKCDEEGISMVFTGERHFKH